MTAPQRQPLSLRISVTDRCQLRCVHCMPPEGVAKLPHEDILTFEEILYFVRIAKARFDLSKVHVTGGEPLVRANVVRLIRMLAAEGIPDLVLTTNGQDLAGKAGALRRAGLHRINVSLPSLDEKTYAALTRGGALGRTLRGIARAQAAGLAPVKLNAVIFRGWNEGEIERLAAFALERGCTMRFLELMPIGCARPLAADRFVPASEIRRRLEAAFALTPLAYEPGRSSRDFLAKDRQGRRGIVGFVSSETQPFCVGCARLRLTSTGEIIGCLSRGRGISIRRFLRSNQPERVEAAIRRVLADKGRHPDFRSRRPMVAVGG
jgi:cyclic pyranopterin phosphate synthase